MRSRTRAAKGYDVMKLVVSVAIIVAGYAIAASLLLSGKTGMDGAIAAIIVIAANRLGVLEYKQAEKQEEK